jgi:uncharacterized protein with PIN domain
MPARFAADEHLGKLARYLRLAGLDVIHRNPFPDDDLMRLARHDQRIVLTMDARLARTLRPQGCLKIRSYDVAEQFLEVFRAHPGDPLEHAFTRCSCCNDSLREATEEEVRSLPPRIRSVEGGHRICPTCRRIFWQGSHYDRMRQRLEGFRTTLATS